MADGALARRTMELRSRVALLGAGVIVLSAIASTRVDTDHPVSLLGWMWLQAPIVPLAIGLLVTAYHRTLASLLLLAGVPGALAAVAMSHPVLVVDLWLSLMWCATLLGYVAAAARLLSVTDGALTSASFHTKHDALPRLTRRVRIYSAIEAATVLAFVVPIVVGMLSPPKTRLVTVSVAALLAVATCRGFLIDLLARHLQGDAGMRSALSRLKRHARRGRPARGFYAAAIVALLGMALFAARGLLWKATS